MTTTPKASITPIQPQNTVSIVEKEKSGKCGGALKNEESQLREISHTIMKKRLSQIALGSIGSSI